jgi:hypothetical protein
VGRGGDPGRIPADAVRNEPRVTMRRGVLARLLTGPSAIDGTPHLVGVRTTDGEELRADVVVDAMGRRSKGPEWLTAIIRLRFSTVV